MQSFLSSIRAPRAHDAVRSFMRFSSTMTGNNYVKRLTMFKVAKEEDIQAVLKAYEVLRKEAARPYIISNVSRKILNTGSPLSEGYTIASQSIFKDHDDHRFYDQECPAHQELKKTTSRVRTGVMTIVTEGQWPEPEL
ncbi:Hypothetical predicted protein [Lecanosticta acicola]|uniref:Stress-response A/B barrel domain-containing protein n=1 Tax=Lecanosticta acicola TaxID=111012 RepID=A0AAI8Z6N7_9PEZI|nr:Hypothetical predicted protein [Lecanosticta acicola]